MKKEIARIEAKMRRFNVEPNKVYVCFMGMTGSGKSTTINYLLGQGENLKVNSGDLGEFLISQDNSSFPAIGNS